MEQLEQRQRGQQQQALHHHARLLADEEDERDKIAKDKDGRAGVPFPAVAALTVRQKLEALANPPRPKSQSDGPSFGG